MGAYGAALYAKKLHRTRSNILNYEQLVKFTHKSQSVACQGCNNHCSLTINTFNDGTRLVAGNKCEKMVHNLDIKKGRVTRLIQNQNGHVECTKEKN